MFTYVMYEYNSEIGPNTIDKILFYYGQKDPEKSGELLGKMK